MNRKVKTGSTAVKIIGAVFTILGLVFLIVAAILLITGVAKTEGYFICIPFLAVGGIFFFVGICFLIWEIKNKKMVKRLIENGNYIWAQITEVAPNYNVTVNGRNPFVVYCQFQDMEGTVHIFKSRDIFFDPQTLLKSEQVRVYVDNDNFKKYYVDIDEILPNVVTH